MLPVSLIATIASLALSIWCDMRIGRARLAVKRGRADAPPLLAARQGAAAAFRGNALFFLLLLALLELAGLPGWFLFSASGVFIAARALLITGSDDDRGVIRSAAVTATLAVQIALALGGIAVAIGIGG